MSASWSDTLHTLREWRAQRLPHGLFVPAAATLVLASTVGRPLVWTSLGLQLGVAWFALASLRLWDDLEDREVDRHVHPGRVWLGSHPVRVGLFVAVGLGIAALWSPLGFAALAVTMGLFYRLRPSAAEAVLLLKYPVIVGLLRGSLDGEGVAAMLVVYGGMLLDAWAAPRLGRPGVLAGIVVLLLAFHLVTR